jgi:hypothetical protein
VCTLLQNEDDDDYFTAEEEAAGGFRVAGVCAPRPPWEAECNVARAHVHTHARARWAAQKRAACRPSANALLD